MIMEILNNFSSIYCFIALVFGAAFMLAMLIIAAIGSKVKESRNKVQFFVTSDDGEKYGLKLWLGRPIWDKKIKAWIAGNVKTYCIANYYVFSFSNLNPDVFADMKEGEIREVFINLED